MDDKTQTNPTPEETNTPPPEQTASVVEPSAAPQASDEQQVGQVVVSPDETPVDQTPEPAPPAPTEPSPASKPAPEPALEQSVPPAPGDEPSAVETPLAAPAESPAASSEASTADTQPVVEAPEQTTGEATAPVEQSPVEPPSEPVAAPADPATAPAVEPVEVEATPEHPAEVVADATAATAVVKTAKSPFVMGVWVMAGAVAVLLGLRFVFHLLAVDPNNFFVDTLYTVTHPLVAPFLAMFNHSEEYIERRFEFESLIAIVFYGLVAWGIASLTKVLRKK